MSVRRKRALLAGIEGQLAAMKDDEFRQRRWLRIGRALDILRSLPLDDFETARRMQLQRQITGLLKAVGQDSWQISQRLTLARADCVIWQLYLRRRGGAQYPPGVQWPPRLASPWGEDPPRAAGVAV